jgi:putative restriction endonuclease
VSGLTDDLRDRLARLRVDRAGSWGPEVRGGAPHKSILLLAVADLVEAGLIRDNAICYDDRLLGAFDGYWRACVGDKPTNPLQPFWYLKGDGGLWQLSPRNAAGAGVVAGARVPSLRLFEASVQHAMLAPELWSALQSPESRDEVRAILVATYFGGELRASLQARHDLLLQSVAYESQLRQRLQRDLRDLFAGDGALDAQFTEESRSAAFRAVVVVAYAHACAVCGASIRTPAGRSVVEAAHIVPFHVCRNNDPRNGLALCPLHHWTFDQGALAVRDDLRIVVHPAATGLVADDGFRRLAGQPLRLPADGACAPSPLALAWHRAHVFDAAV